ncbi:type IV conjugative transfer system coupling protein TraD [Kosakonia sp. S58]|uniref:type IV conjugative transfer system coupling protein TraD n=1 Tax=unclassified Kosakonia TaxID=2632876 RepID=UPI001904C5E3|nr:MULTISPECIES: type IV conjugative transfer system coupling protein TraD [unclassified Kosakonia]MBK0079760.1 type IV conjugative transfer system coupling protein TraD [Kosakonia sp. S57]MBK0086730.1 type IV conjugative transfer system coupling protein TraD [Kosakonia sp. S58]
MSFKGKNLTQGGQMTAYRWRMFLQVNNWIGYWVFLLFGAITACLFFWLTPQEMLDNGSWYWFARVNESFIDLMPAGQGKFYEIHYFYAPTSTTMTLKMTLQQMLKDPYMQFMGDRLAGHLQTAAAIAGAVSMAVFVGVAWYIARIGKQESEDEYISGMKLTEEVSEVNALLRKNGELSDLRIGDLHLVKNAEVMNFLIHGTVSVGKSTAIRWLLDIIRRRGDRAIIYDSGCTFVETHYNPDKDFILNPHDSRCPDWRLWEECLDVIDFENFATSLIPVEGDSDPFWVSSSRTIASDLAIRMSADPERSIEKYLKTLLSLSMKSLREYLANTTAANLVEEKIEKTAISIRSVVTNYAKALRFLQGLDDGTRPSFTIRNWMTSDQYSDSWLFISTQARHRKSVRPLISMWMSMATLYLQSMGENPDRRVWFIIDEKPSLQRIPQFEETLAEARKFGGCFVIGIQNMPQLINTYGREVAKAIFDLLNTRMYGRSPSAEVAKMVEEELGNQRRREAREQNSYGLDQVRDGISIGKDKVSQPIVDYEEVMQLRNLKFYVRLPGEYPVVKLALKYRKTKKRNIGLIERNIRDALSPELEKVIRENERDTALAGLVFPTGEEHLEKAAAQAQAQPSGQPANPAPAVTPSQRVQPARKDAVQPPAPESIKPAPSQVTRPEPSLPRRPGVAHLRSVPPEIHPENPTTEAVNDAPTAIKPSPLPKTPLHETPASASPLELLNRMRRKPLDADAAESSESEGGGEAQELRMQVTQLENGGLELKTAGQPGTASGHHNEDGNTRQRMEREEENILVNRHPEDPGFDEADFERDYDGEHER